MTEVDVASRTADVPRATVSGRVFTSYDEALRESGAALVYVSTRNHEHVPWVMAALQSGRHVVVDKPAALSVADSEAMAEEAARRGLLVAEANVWAWHPQIEVVRRLAIDRGPLTRVSAMFVVPALGRPNYRYEAACGGGVLWDLGPYAVSCGREFFGEPAQAISATAVVPEGEEVDTSFSVLMRYPGDRVLTGHFGMPLAYWNRLDLGGPRFALTIERAFTTSADAPARIVEWTDGTPSVIDVPAADAFACFLSAVGDAIRSGACDRFVSPLVADARMLGRLRQAAGR